MPDNERLLSLGETADLLHVSDITVRRMVKAGRLRSLLIGGRYRIRPRDLATYLDSLAVGSPSPQ